MAYPFSIVIPTYNEAGGIERLFERWMTCSRQHGLDGEIIVVDDNSPDGTGAIVDALAARTTRCAACTGPASSGSRAASSTAGSSRARSRDALGAMDADFSHDIDALPAMVAALASDEYGLADRQPLRSRRRHRQLAAAPQDHLARRDRAGASR